MKILKFSNAKIACIGPQFMDRRHGQIAPFVRIRGLNLIQECCKDLHGIIPVDHLIASGSMIPMTTLDAVGSMEESLFIDYVDLEWCERALYFGYQAYGVCAALMEHELGDKPIYFMGGWRPVRSPLRHYYIFRNAIWIYKQAWPRWNWKFIDAIRLARKFIFYSLYAKPQSEHFRMMTLGIWHGIVGKMGKFKG